jgi:hypothetical protein
MIVSEAYGCQRLCGETGDASKMRGLRLSLDSHTYRWARRCCAPADTATRRSGTPSRRRRAPGSFAGDRRRAPRRTACSATSSRTASPTSRAERSRASSRRCVLCPSPPLDRLLICPVRSPTRARRGSPRLRRTRRPALGPRRLPTLCLSSLLAHSSCISSTPSASSSSGLYTLRPQCVLASPRAGVGGCAGRPGGYSVGDNEEIAPSAADGASRSAVGS